MRAHVIRLIQPLRASERPISPDAPSDTDSIGRDSAVILIKIQSPAAHRQMTPTIIRQQASKVELRILSCQSNSLLPPSLAPLCLWAGDVVLTNEARFAVLLWLWAAAAAAVLRKSPIENAQDIKLSRATGRARSRRRLEAAINWDYLLLLARSI